MKSKARITPCASSDCTRLVEARSRYAAQYCPVCKEKRKRESQRRFERYKRGREHDQLRNPDLALDKKLDEAEFSVLHDAGPEEGAFRPGARLSYYEVISMLKHECLAVNSVLVHVESQRQHRVVRGRRGHLTLEPRYVPSEEDNAKNHPCSEDKITPATNGKPSSRRYMRRRRLRGRRRRGRETKRLSRSQLQASVTIGREDDDSAN